jgi:hypothetical protein
MNKILMDQLYKLYKTLIFHWQSLIKI